MWIFLPNAFLSIVEHRDDPNLLLVRARLQGDIFRVFPAAVISATPDADYPYRTVCTREQVKQRLADFVLGELDYDNFKDAVPKKEILRHDHYRDVWAIMLGIQHPNYGQVRYPYAVIGADARPTRKQRKQKKRKQA